MMDSYLDLRIEDREGEEWKDILGYDGIYMASSQGRIKSYSRIVDNGVKGLRLNPSRILKQTISKSNTKTNLKGATLDLKVSLCVDNIKRTFHVSTIIGSLFVGDLKNGEVYSKKDKIWSNNNASNLEIKSVSDSIKISYEKGNNLKKKKHLLSVQKCLFIYTRLIDNKNFTATELIEEYKKEMRSNIKKAIEKDKIAYGTKWERQLIKDFNQLP